MAATTGNGSSGDKKSQNGTEKPLSSLHDRMQFHGQLHEGSKCDLQSPASIVANVNIKQLLTPAAFDSLPTHYQRELIKLLPESDRLCLDDSQEPLAMTVTALSNEFFAKSCVEYRDRLRNGEFSASNSCKPDAEPVVWECDSNVLRVKLTETGVPKAGEAFVCMPKELPSPPVKRIKTVRKYEKNKPLVEAKAKVAATTRQSALKHKLSPSKTTGITKVKTVATQDPVVTTPAPPEPPPPPPPAATSTSSTSLLSSQTQTKVKKEQTSPVHPVHTKPPTVITKLRKVTESNPSGITVTKVIPVPVVVRNPHGQVVTTLANCNPLLSQMIKNKNTQTQTAKPVRVEKKRSLLPTILKRNNNPVIITLKTTRGKNGQTVTANGETVNKAVSDVIAKIQSSQAQPVNGTSHNRPLIVTYNGSGANGTAPPSKKLVTTAAAVNVERSKQICETSKQSQPTLNLERSYQICKQVLGSSGSSSIVSVVVGPGGKKTTILSKPVRNRLHLQNSSTGSGGQNQVSQLTSDIAIYKNKYRGKPLLTNSGHVFLALNDDRDGYAAKAYKRKTAFKIRPKKKLMRSSSVKKSSATPPHPSTTTPTSDQQQSTGNSTPTTSVTTSGSSSSRDVTTVTDSVLAGQPIASVASNSSINNPTPPTNSSSNTSGNGNQTGGSNSLLTNCMCNLRALVICNKCGAFNHAECMAKDYCLACLDSEN